MNTKEDYKPLLERVFGDDMIDVVRERIENRQERVIDERLSDAGVDPDALVKAREALFSFTCNWPIRWWGPIRRGQLDCMNRPSNSWGPPRIGSGFCFDRRPIGAAGTTQSG